MATHSPELFIDGSRVELEGLCLGAGAVLWAIRLTIRTFIPGSQFALRVVVNFFGV
ncbi:hypothetical protein AURDEDRAFT_116269 [Auricularia subglabra TFB-10046 SS5]|uniref:Uncharacterized protein n=1 Tax=Auricularia subglabra (strain TFB-10046 / SS5) TaxID=717982 RepID=J0D140_AURST|nr:hypothetical protein AURDEDRAFT_116269 [Auricularia subglabra TFB-10046 SS5]